MTDNVEGRLKRLNDFEGIPFSFRAYATYEVENPKDVEDSIHKLIGIINPDLRAIELLENGRKRTREFYKISPGRAYKIFEKVSHLRGDSHKLNWEKPTLEQEEEEAFVEKINRRSRRWSFRSLEIPIGAELEYLGDREKKCKVFDEVKRVEYDGESCELHELLHKLFGRGGLHPVKYFRYDGEVLVDRLDRMEREKDELKRAMDD